MRPLRLLAPCDPENGCPVMYHVTSRVVEKRFIFKERERRKFLKLAKDFAVFSGFELVSWCLMSNHFHLLVRVPVQDVEALSDEEMIRRMARILNPQRLEKIVARINGASDVEERRGILECFRKRVGHLPSYVKAVKQEFTQWFNHVSQREGTLWEGRYHSTLIEDMGGQDPAGQLNGAGEIARIVASYIDMNPVRAKVEGDPKDSTWSSYGAALAGDAEALRGLRILWGTAPQSEETNCGEDQKRPRLDAAWIAMHRRWILRGLEAHEGSESLPASASEEGSGEGVARQRERPPHLNGLRRIRLLGSQAFMSRFGVAACSATD